MTNHHRLWLWVLLLICSLLGLSSCHATPTSAGTIKIGVLRVPNDVAVARQRHLLQKDCQAKGLTVQFIAFDSGVDANKALIANDVQLATMGHTNAVVALAAGISAKIVWINDIIGSNEALVVRQKAGIDTWGQLKHKKIATPFASTSHYSLMMLLQQHHLTNQVEVLDMQTPEIVAAWQRGDIDGAYTWEPSLSALLGNKQLIDSRQMAQTGHLTANVTLATNAFIRTQPDVLRTLLATLNTIHSQYQDLPQSIYRTAAKSLSLPVATVKKQIGTSQWLSDQSQRTFMTRQFRAQFFETAQFMWRQQTLTKPVSQKDCDRFITPRYLN